MDFSFFQKFLDGLVQKQLSLEWIGFMTTLLNPYRTGLCGVLGLPTPRTDVHYEQMHNHIQHRRDSSRSERLIDLTTKTHNAVIAEALAL